MMQGRYSPPHRRAPISPSLSPPHRRTSLSPPHRRTSLSPPHRRATLSPPPVISRKPPQNARIVVDGFQGLDPDFYLESPPTPWKASPLIRSARKSNKNVAHLIEMEIAFQEDLHRFIKTVLIPCRTVDAHDKKRIQLFIKVVQSLRDKHQTLLMKLQEFPNYTTVSDHPLLTTILKMINEMEPIYRRYCENFFNDYIMLTKLRQISKDRVQDSLELFMYRPFEMLTAYKRLVYNFQRQEIAEESSLSHLDSQPLNNLESLIAQSKTEVSAYKQVHQLENDLRSCDETIDLTDQFRRILLRSTFDLADLKWLERAPFKRPPTPSRIHCILLSDKILVLAAKKVNGKVTQHILLQWDNILDVSVIQLKPRAGDPYATSMVISIRKVASFKVFAANPEVKTHWIQWLDTLHSELQEPELPYLRDDITEDFNVNKSPKLGNYPLEPRLDAQPLMDPVPISTDENTSYTSSDPSLSPNIYSPDMQPYPINDISCGSTPLPAFGHGFRADVTDKDFFSPGLKSSIPTPPDSTFSDFSSPRTEALASNESKRKSNSTTDPVPYDRVGISQFLSKPSHILTNSRDSDIWTPHNVIIEFRSYKNSNSCILGKNQAGRILLRIILRQGLRAYKVNPNNIDLVDENNIHRIMMDDTLDIDELHNLINGELRTRNHSDHSTLPDIQFSLAESVVDYKPPAVNISPDMVDKSLANAVVAKDQISIIVSESCKMYIFKEKDHTWSKIGSSHFELHQEIPIPSQLTSMIASPPNQRSGLPPNRDPSRIRLVVKANSQPDAPRRINFSPGTFRCDRKAPTKLLLTQRGRHYGTTTIMVQFKSKSLAQSVVDYLVPNAL